MSSLAVCHRPAFQAHLEPVQQLAPYLSGLDVSEALDGFTELADRILTGPAATTASAAAATTTKTAAGCQDTCRLAELDIGLLDSFETDFHAQSPGGLSCASSQWLSSSSPSSSSSSSSVGFSSGANSPAPSDIYQQAASSLASPSSCSSPSSRSSSSSSSGKAKRLAGPSGNRRPASDSRRRNNATAAERYRQKVKGRKCGLTEQLDEQLQRNERLRRQVEAKLALYGEFVALLASQTAPDDAELAHLGASSLGAVLAELASLPELLDGHQHHQLTSHLQHFQSVLGESASQSASQSAQTPPVGRQVHPQVAVEGPPAGLHVDQDQPQMLEYDFYADNFSFVACQ